MDRIVAQDEQLVSISKLDRTGTSDFNAFSCQVIHEKPSDPHAFLSAQILKHAHVSEVFLCREPALGCFGACTSPEFTKKKQWSFSKAAKKQAEMQAEMLEQDTWAVQNLATLCNIWT